MTKPLPSTDRKPRSDQFGDPDFKGLGVLKCHICKKAIAEHDYIGPCRERTGPITIGSRNHGRTARLKP